MNNGLILIAAVEAIQLQQIIDYAEKYITCDPGDCADCDILRDIIKMATPPNTEWIDINQKLPEPGQRVIRYGFDFTGNEHYDTGELVAEDGLRWADWGATHWQPLPPPPNTGV